MPPLELFQKIMNKGSPFSKNLIRRLVQAKQVFLHGKGHSLRPGEFDKLQAILSFDQAVELFLHTVIAEMHGDYKIHDGSFYKLLSNADLCTRKLTRKGEKKTELSLPFKSEIKDSVHELRNNSQHKGHIPSKSDLLRAMEYTEEFLRRSFMICFDKSFDEIFLADAIRYKDVKQFFREAEEALSKDDFENTIVGLAKSYRFLKPHMAKNLPWDDSLESMLNSNPYEQNPDHTENTIEMIKYVDSKVNVLSSGGNLQDFKLFLAKAPTVNISQGGYIQVHLKACREPITEKEIIRMFDFVYNTALHCQGFEH